MKPLTPRQQQVLDFIVEHSSEYGYPPTLREIAGRFDLSGPRAAVKHLDALVRKSCIRRNPGSSRGIEVLFRGNTLKPPEQDVAAAVRGTPVLGTVPAGPLDLAMEDAENTLILDPAIARDGTFLLKVKGDSMTGDHILPGDMVLVKKQDTAAQGDIVVVLIGEEATLKRFRREGKKIILLPSNPDYQPVVLDEHSESARIIGKIEAVIRIIGR
jgi:repressor LexA